MAGNKRGSRRRFGSVRQLRSGRWQARYPDPVTGQLRSAERTFPTKRDAEIELSQIESDITRGQWVDPEAGQVNFGEYGAAWLRERDLSPRTFERYEGAWRLHIAPVLGERTVAGITAAQVRRWRQDRIDAGVGTATVAKAYRLLRAIMNTALDDGLITRNPCRIKGAGDDKSPERPVLTVEEVYAVADAIPVRYRSLVLLAAFSSLRFGELAALQRRDIDLEERVVRVWRTQGEMGAGTLFVKGPKSEAGKRPVAFPESLVPELRRHLDWFAQREAGGLVFIGPLGGGLRRSNFRDVWIKALEKAGVPKIRFHDLRHTGNTLAAATGASTRELMHRMGHSSMRAALIYQHMAAGRDRLIADGMDTQIQEVRKARKEVKPKDPPGSSGTDLARG
jgi:integrase